MLTKPMHPFLAQIDRIGILTRDPESLSDFFVKVLGLPVVLPHNGFSGYQNTSIDLGNLTLEIARFRPFDRNGTARFQASRYHLLGFKVREGAMASGLAELSQRGFSHSAEISSVFNGMVNLRSERACSVAYLGKLLGETNVMRWFFYVTHHLFRNTGPRTHKANPSLYGHKIRFHAIKLRAFIHALFRSSLRLIFRNGIPVLTEYMSDEPGSQQAIDRPAFQERKGGSLGIQNVLEVVIGMPDLAVGSNLWGRLYAPLVSDAIGRWQLGEGPAVRLVPHSRPEVITFVLRVASFAHVMASLYRAEIQGYRTDNSLAITLPGTGGLTLRLVE